MTCAISKKNEERSTDAGTRRNKEKSRDKKKEIIDNCDMMWFMYMQWEIVLINNNKRLY